MAAYADCSDSESSCSVEILTESPTLKQSRKKLEQHMQVAPLLNAKKAMMAKGLIFVNAIIASKRSALKLLLLLLCVTLKSRTTN